MNDNITRQPDWDERPDELIGGKLVMMASPSPFHNWVAGNIYAIFHRYLKGKQCSPFGDNTKVFLSKTDHFIPDAMIVCDADKVKYNGIHGAPDLVVEVLPPLRQNVTKRKKKTLTRKRAFGSTGWSVLMSNIRRWRYTCFRMGISCWTMSTPVTPTLNCRT